MLTKIVYVDPSIPSAGDGSSPALALDNLPECSALEDDTCYLIRRTSQECLITHTATNTTVSKIAIIGFPARTDARYAEMPEAAKTAWGNDPAGKPVVVIDDNKMWNLTVCGFLDLYNIDIQRSTAVTYYSQNNYGIYLSGSVNKTIRICNCRMAGKDEPIDSGDFTTTPTEGKSCNYIRSFNGVIEEVLIDGNTICLGPSGAPDGMGDSRALAAISIGIESRNTGTITIKNNVAWGTTGGSETVYPYYSRMYQFIYLVGGVSGTSESVHTGSTYRITNNHCYIRKCTYTTYPGFIYIYNIYTYGDMYVDDLTYEDSTTLPHFGTPAQLFLDSSVLRAWDYSYYGGTTSEYYYHKKWQERVFKNIRVNLPGLYYLGDHVICISNSGTISNITINLAANDSAKVGTAVKTVSTSSSGLGYYNGNSYAALAIDGITTVPAKLSDISVTLCVGKDLACEFRGVCGQFDEIGGRIYAYNCTLDIDTLTYLEPCVTDNPTTDYKYYVAAISYDGYNNEIKVNNLVLGSEPNFAVNGARAITPRSEWWCDNSGICVKNSNFKTWGGTSLFPNSTSQKLQSDMQNRIRGVIVCNDGDAGFFQAYDSIHISKATTVFREGSTAARSILYNGVSNNQDHAQIWQWLGDGGNQVIVGRNLSAGEHTVNYYVLVSGITLSELRSYFRIELYYTDSEKVELTPVEDTSTWVGGPSGATAVKLTGKIALPSAQDLYARIRMRGYQKTIYIDPIPSVN